MTELPQRREPGRSVFPSPRDGATFGVNPDGFIWVPEPEAASYELRVCDHRTDDVVLRETVARNYHVPRQPFHPGEYVWTVRAFDADGAVIGQRSPWTFTVPDDAPTIVAPTGREILAGVPDEHPQLVFPSADLDAIRDRVATDQSAALDDLERVVEDAYADGLPDPPTFHTRETYAAQRQSYNDYFHHVRHHIDRNLRACSLYYLLTGDEDAGEFARDIIRHVCGFTPDGPNSLEVDVPGLDWYWGDEAGLSYGRILAECYDWTYDRFDKRERVLVERNLVTRCRTTYDRLRGSDFFADPSSSHIARLPGFLGQLAILLEHRLDPGEAVEMLDYVMDVFCTFYPHWGGDGGGWAEGPNYGAAYTTMWHPPFFATLERHLDVSLWERPFYRNVAEFFLYTVPPNAEDLPFGDAHERPPTAANRRVFELYGAVHDEPVWLDRADRIADVEDASHDFGFHRFLYPPTGERRPPTDRPNCRAFPDIGWAALHSDLAAPDRDNYLVFRSSPYGNISHSHNNQNALAIASGGHSLAISSGYYPLYGFPHHDDWTRETKAHNAVTVGGAGQERGLDATGELAAFEDAAGHTYLRGEAGGAYPAPVDRADRHVLYVPPGLYLILDDVVAPGAESYEWGLHTHEAPTIDDTADAVTIRRGPARLDCSLLADAALEWSVTDAFDPPVAEGFEDELEGEFPDQHHLTASTDGGNSRRFLAVCRVGQPGTDEGHDLPSVELDRTGDVIDLHGAGFSGRVDLAGDPLIDGTVSGDRGESSVTIP